MRYAEHGCHTDPREFEAGFREARIWYDGTPSPLLREAIYQAIKDSTDVPFPETARKVGLAPSPWTEGFMLGVYGLHALTRHTTTTGTP